MTLKQWLRSKTGRELTALGIGIGTFALLVWVGWTYHGDPALGAVAGLLSGVGFVLYWPYKLQSEKPYNTGPVRRGAAAFALLPGGIIVFLFADIGGLPGPAIVFGPIAALVVAAVIYLPARSLLSTAPQ